MAGKISEYTTEQTTLQDTDRLDVSTGIGGTPVTEYLSWGSLKTQLGTAGFLETVDLGYTTGTRTVTNTGGVDAVLPLFTDTIAGLVPLSGGSATDFLSADGTWKAAGADGNGIYTASGSLSGVTTVTQGTNTLTFATTADANNLVIANGGVGVGKVPTVKLDVLGSTNFSSDSWVLTKTSSNYTTINQTTNAGGVFQLLDLQGSGGKAMEFLSTATATAIRLYKGNGGALDGNLFAGGNGYINATSGNFGVGTASPTSKLHVGGDTRIDGNQSINGNLSLAASTYRIQVGTLVDATTQLLVKSSGGLTNLFRFVNNSSVDVLSSNFSGVVTGNWSASSTLTVGSPVSSSAQLAMKATGAKSYGIYLEDNSAGLSIVNSSVNGNVGIGTLPTANKLHVVGDTQIDGDILVNGTKVIGSQGASVADATDAASAITQLNLVISRLEAHGLIATV